MKTESRTQTVPAQKTGHDCGMYRNALHPERMTADERLDEVADILASGLLRLQKHESANNSNNFGDFPLDLPAHQSVHGPDPRQNGE